MRSGNNCGDAKGGDAAGGAGHQPAHPVSEPPNELVAGDVQRRRNAAWGYLQADASAAEKNAVSKRDALAGGKHDVVPVWQGKAWGCVSGYGYAAGGLPASLTHAPR